MHQDQRKELNALPDKALSPNSIGRATLDDVSDSDFLRSPAAAATLGVCIAHLALPIALTLVGYFWGLSEGFSEGLDDHYRVTGTAGIKAGIGILFLLYFFLFPAFVVSICGCVIGVILNIWLRKSVWGFFWWCLSICLIGEMTHLIVVES